MKSHFLDVLGLQMKPVGPTCNIQCDYCYVEPFKGRVERMSDEVLERAISSLLVNSNHPTISWHGGEPMLAGIEFYVKAMMFIDKHVRSVPVRNQIQTNATLVTPEFARFFREHNFAVGVSLDGPKNIHDEYRVDFVGNGTHDRVMKGLAVLRESEVDPSVTATITSKSVNQVVEILDYLIESGFRQIRFSPVFDPDTGRFGISSDEWGRALIQVFDAWFDREDPNIHVRDLDLVMAWLLDRPIPLCTGNFGCLNWVSVDPRGNLYPCEYFKGEYPYGNVQTMDFSEIESTDSFQRYQRLLTVPPEKCSDCRFMHYCGNGCSATRMIGGKADPRGVDAYCESKKILFEHIKRVFEENS